MEYRAELKPFEGEKEGVKYKILDITDISLHSEHMRQTSIPKEIRRAFDKKEAGRIYTQAKPPIEPSARRQFVIDLLKNDPKIVSLLQEEEKKGYKILIRIPSEGIPLKFGRDAIEFMNSKNGKRILRGLANKKNSA